MNEQFNEQPFIANGANEQQWQAQQPYSQPQYQPPQPQPQPQQYGQPYAQPQQVAQPRDVGMTFAKIGFIIGIIAIALIIQIYLIGSISYGSSVLTSRGVYDYYSSTYIVFAIFIYLCYIMVALQAIFSTIGLVKNIFKKDVKGIIFASVGVVLAIISTIICGNIF